MYAGLDAIRGEQRRRRSGGNSGCGGEEQRFATTENGGPGIRVISFAKGELLGQRVGAVDVELAGYARARCSGLPAAYAEDVVTLGDDGRAKLGDHS